MKARPAKARAESSERPEGEKPPLEVLVKEYLADHPTPKLAVKETEQKASATRARGGSGEDAMPEHDEANRLQVDVLKENLE